MTSKSRLAGNLVSNGNLTPTLTPKRIGIGSTAPQYSLDVVGDINYSGTLRNLGNPVSFGSSSGLPISGGTMSGIITFSAAQTLNNLKFTQIGIGSSVRTVDSKLNELPSVLDFIPSTEHANIKAGISTYDCTTAFQAAIDAHRCVYVPYGVYRVSATINLNTSYSGLVGDLRMPWIVRTDPTTSPAIKITATGGDLNEFSRLENILLWHGIPGGTVNTSDNPRPSYPITPTVNTSSGIAIDGTGSSANPAVQRTLVRDVRVIGWGIGIYLGPQVNTKLERIIIENHNIWSSYNTDLNSSNKYVGFYFNATPVTVGGISPMASVELLNCIVNGNYSPSQTNSFGFYGVGSDLRDIFLTNCETAGGNYGFFFESTSENYDWDIHLIRPIVDAYKIHGIVLKNISGPSGASIIGGYAIRDPAGSGNAGLSGAILLENCDSCSISSGFQIYGYTSDDIYDDGIRLYNSTRTTISGCIIKNARFGISLDNSSLNTIIGNEITGISFSAPWTPGPTDNAAPALAQGIRLFNTANGNSITGNVISGASVSYPYDYGIYVEAASIGNILLGNAIEVTTVTTPHYVPTKPQALIPIYGNVLIDGSIQATTPNGSGSTGGIIIKENTDFNLAYLQFVNAGVTSEYGNISASNSGDVSINPQTSLPGFNGKIVANGKIRLNTSPAELEFTASGPRFRVDTANTLRVHTGGGLGSTNDELLRLNPAGVGIGTTTYRQKLDVEGAVLATGGFISAGSTTPIRITLSGNQLVFTAPGVGSTSLTLV